MTLTEFMDYRYKNREDKDNMFCVGVSDAEFRMFIINYLLGEDWYVTDPIGQTQVNEIALDEILNKYSKRYRKECKRRINMSEDIELVIKIPKELKEAIDNAKKENAFNYMRVYNDTIYDTLKNGTPLDKIRSEIMDTGAFEQEVHGKTEFLKGIDYCLSVIDKYKSKSEE